MTLLTATARALGSYPRMTACDMLARSDGLHARPIVSLPTGAQIQMSRIPASAKELRRSATTLSADAKRVAGDASRLLLFYAVECKMKERYLVRQLSKRHGDTSAIDEDPQRPFGSTGHDLGAGAKALRAPATLVDATPHLLIREQAKPVEYAHQAWRYGIACSRSEAVEAWLSAISSWLEDTR